MIRRLILLSAVLLLTMNFSFGQYHERDWSWKPYASLTKGGNIFMVVYYGTLIDGYNGKVRWKFENRAAKPLFGVELGKQTYELKSDKTVTRDARKFKSRRIEPGESAMTLPVVVEQQPFSGVELVSVESPEIILNFGKDRIYEWGKLGKVELSVQ